MSDAALELYNSISSYYRLKDLINNGESEGLHLECKSPAEPKLNQGLQKQLAKSISGFSNTAGGIIIWGISTTKHAHSNLDILTQIEPIGNCSYFEKLIHSRIPGLTTPPILGYKTKIIKRLKKDTKGVILTYIPKGTGDPIQSNKDNLFYFRTGDELNIAPYEIIKRLFAANETPSIKPNLRTDRAEYNTTDRSWTIPIAYYNNSSAIGEHVLTYINVLNMSSCNKFEVPKFQDVSSLGPGTTRFQFNIIDVIHRGINIHVGEIIVTMKGGVHPKRRLDLSIDIYANKMRAIKTLLTLHISSSSVVINRQRENYIY